MLWRGTLTLCLERHRTFQGIYRVKTVDSHGRSRRGRAVVVVVLPHRVRLELLDPMGRTQGLLVARRDRAALLLPSLRALYRSSTSGPLLGMLSGVEIPASFLAPLLAGCVPGNDLPKLEVARTTDTAVHLAPSDDSAFPGRTYVVSPADGRLLEASFTGPRDAIRIALGYSTADPRLPQRLEIVGSQGKVSLVRSAFLTGNPPDPSAFEIPSVSAEDYQIYDVD